MGFSLACFTTIILSFLASVVAQSFGELVVLQHPPTDNGTRRKLTCLSEDDDSAIIWNDDVEIVPDSFQRQRPTPRIVIRCAILNGTSCGALWGYTNKWKLVNSANQPMGPVFDYRWEGFQEFGYQNVPVRYNRYQYVRTMTESSGTMIFSARGSEDFHIILCETRDPQGGPCIEIALAVFFGERSIIRTCYHGILDDICTDVVNVSHGSTDVLKPYEWRTFRVKWNSEEKRIEVFNNTDTKPFLETKVDYWVPLSHIILKIMPSRARFHFYEYFWTNENNSVLTTGSIYLDNSDFCVRILLGMCANCQMKIDLINQFDQPITNKSIFGNHEFVDSGLLSWRSINLTANISGRRSVRLRIETILKEGERNGLWAVDRFRICKSVDGIRESTKMINGFNANGHTVWSSISCQKLSYRKSTVVTTGVIGSIGDDTSQLQQLVQRWVNSCGSSCASFGKEWSVCSSNGCSCNPGYSGKNCAEECSTTTYGYGCNKKCGSCHWTEYCDRTNGYCGGGCTNERLLLPLCNKELAEPTILRIDDNTAKVFQYVELDADAEIYVRIHIEGVLVKYLPMYRAGIEGMSVYEANIVDLEPNSSYEANTVVFIPSISGTTESRSQTIIFTTSPGNLIDGKKFQSHSHDLIWLTVLPVLVIGIIIILFIRHCRNRGRVPKLQRETSYLENILSPSTSTSTNHLPTVHISPRQAPHPLEMMNSELSDTLYSLPKMDDSCVVHIGYFEEYAKVAVAKGILHSQFSLLRKGLKKPCDYGRFAENMPKNRNKNLLPYDDTRVVLKKVTGDPYSDYINASFIEGFEKKRAYIAGQGPMPNTINDFWRMVWQEQVRVICMLTNVIEGTETKCEKYWPDVGTRMNYGDFLVSNIDNQVSADYTFRTFELSYKQIKRKVTHLHYTGWPSLGVPMHPQSLVSYLKKLEQTPTGDGPIVVHCSTGDDRTGTMILCDICLRQGVVKEEIDVTATVTKMRDSRANMVGTLQQYVLAHIVIVESLMSLPTWIPCSEVLSPNMQRIREQLLSDIQRLNDTAWQDRALRFLDVLRPQNILSELSSEAPEAVYCKLFESESSQFYAESVDGIKAKKEYLAASLPSSSILSDFWKFVAQKNIKLIVILQCSDPRHPTCCDIMPAESTVGPTPYIQVENQTRPEEEQNFTNEKLLLNYTEENAGTQSLTVLTCKGWGHGENGKPPTPAGLVSLWIASEKISRGEGQTLILCHNGVTGCGLYLALSFLLERMAVERECDVISAVRAVRRSNLKFVQSVEQFEYLYNAAVSYVKFFEIYANFS